MTEKTNILNRMRDVGFALSTAGEFGQSLSRIQLQKFIYLVDVVSPLFYTLPPQRAHLTYKHGPYDVSIQNAVDALAFRGFVKILGVQKNNDGTICTEYTLTDAGETWVSRLSKEEAFIPRYRAALAVGSKVERFGWYRLVDLVYAEPTFTSTKPKGYGQELRVNDGLTNSAAFLMAMLDRAIQYGHEKKDTSVNLVVELFFRYLDEYDHLQRTLRFSQSDAK